MTLQKPHSLAVPGLDAAAARRWARCLPVASPWLHEEVAKRMAQRLEWFREMPDSWLHWEPAFGGMDAHRHLREKLPKADCRVWANDMAHALKATREAAHLSWNPAQWRRAHEPSAIGDDASVAMVWANMALHGEPLPGDMLQRWHGLLKPDGFVMFSCLGPDSLLELRGVYARMGWPEPAHAFTDMHDWGDMLVASGFAEPVMDMERITLTFSHVDAYLQELRGLGRNLNENRFAALRGRGWHEALRLALDSHIPRDESGRLVMTFEVVYGHAFKPQPRVPMKAEQAVSVDVMRAMLRTGRR
ncbi:biotin synthase [Hydrogenophaga crassostreae]|uniref:Biotin synthase n=1 Tax=Hydrogenophaga crassostreae TaxID=1763535 RepID=A0A162T415_9BURK|nr:biotin synthase [Hydrogenophaga crassostreae]AOW14621.1 biotin synthase [Hydrogenophaga crassostreae]OAD43282.1 biotin synthase [Hydrogenophaga crassostreae]